MNRNEKILARIKGGLVVSCQALKSEPLYSSYIMSRMAYAAKEGGAVGIRANTPEDINEIKKTVDLPIIALYKKDYPDSPIYITPTEKEIDLLIEASPEIIALDATNRLHPDGIKLDDFFGKIRNRSSYSTILQSSFLSFHKYLLTTQCGFSVSKSGRSHAVTN